MKPAIVRLNVNPLAGHEEAVRRALLTRLNAHDDDAVAPILLRWVRARFDLEVLVAVYDFARFDALLNDVIRTIEGVSNTHAHVYYDGFLFAGGILMASNAQLNGGMYAEAVVDLLVAPGADRAVFAALYDLPEADDLHKYALLKDMTGANSNLSLQLAGTHRETIEEYVQRFVRNIDGVVDTHTAFTHGWAMLMTSEDYLALQTQFSPL